jgi:pantoate--beta-alanine ligase
MRVIKNVNEMSEAANELRAAGKGIGFVPTMGYLHAGHLSLVKLARRENDITALSIFVNPTQFGQGEDMDRYPRDLPGDIEKCRREDVDIVFAPGAEEIYRPGFSTHINVERVSERLCGAARPGHFRGVATVVAKLFNIVRPDRAYFGQKDHQQTVVVRRMAVDLNFGTEIIVGPTVREPDGLAMSSRNAYLNPDERMAAVQIYRSLASARSLRQSGETRPDTLVAKVKESLDNEHRIKVEYVELVDPDELTQIPAARDRALLALAVRIGKTRLIDNMII